MIIKGYILTGDIVVIHCEEIEGMKWKIIIQIITYKKEYDKDNEYLLWRICDIVGRRIWCYYLNECMVNNKEKIEIEENIEMENDDDNDENNVKLLKELFDSDKYKDTRFDKYIQECVGLDQYILTKLKPIKQKWMELYDDNDFVDMNVIDSFKNVTKQMYHLFRQYKQKQYQ